MNLPRSLYNIQGPEQIRAFRSEMFSYSVAREGIYLQKAEVTLEQALREIEENLRSQKNQQDQFLKDKPILQVFDKYLLGDKNVEISEYHKVLSIDTKYAIVYCNEGHEKSLLFDCEGALADYSKAIEIDPNYAHAYYNRGSAKQKLGDINGACQGWSKAGNLGHNWAHEMPKKYCKLS